MNKHIPNLAYIVGPPSVGKSFLMTHMRYLLEKYNNAPKFEFICEDTAVREFLSKQLNTTIENLSQLKDIIGESWAHYLQSAYTQNIKDIAHKAKNTPEVFFVVSTGGLAPLRDPESYKNGTVFYISPVNIEIYWTHFKKHRLDVRGYAYLLEQNQATQNLDVISIGPSDKEKFEKYYHLSDSMLKALVASSSSNSKVYFIKSFYFQQHRDIALNMLKNIISTKFQNYKNKK